MNRFADAAAASCNFARRYFPGSFDRAKTAPEWEQAGFSWEPDAQVITNLNDNFHFPQVVECIRQHSKGIVAYAILPVLSADTLSIEIQFASEAEASAFQKAYRKVRLHKPRLKTNGPTKRLYRNRMYILPDGREFWLYFKWDSSRRIGKVVAQQGVDGTCTLKDEIVDDDLLMTCSLVPKGQEPWRI